MKLLSYLFVCIVIFNVKHSHGAAMGSSAEAEASSRTTALVKVKKVDPYMVDPKNVALVVHIRGLGIYVPLGEPPESYVPEDLKHMPPPLPRLSNPFDIMALAREGESSGPYLWAMRSQMTTESMETKDAEGQTALIKIINDDACDFNAFSVLMNHPTLFHKPDDDGVLPIFAAINAEEDYPEEYPYGLSILKAYVIASIHAGQSFEQFLDTIKSSIHPDTGVSLHDRILGLSKGSFIRNAYELIIGKGGEEYLRIMGQIS